MSGKYTPGPWSLDAMGNIWALDTKVCEMSEIPAQAIGYREKHIVEHKSNANLISCAPSLLEQLESICTIAKWNGGNVPYAEIKAAMELIAKAKGE